ncbi:hypothetical protein niasHT_035048 [Heterodera trifolii]|uniref:Uncharacterized protein n=1 Tax=Heterodera trifolii TaxID=157864 RepID=A0ABD2J5I2_9BILA
MKIKRIVTAGLLFTSLATGGAGAIQRSNVPGANVTGQMHPLMPNRAMPPPPPPPELNPLEKTKAIIEEHVKKINFTESKRESPGGPATIHHP